MQEDQFLVPDYYPSFRCKMGACRTPCCEGWPISVTMQDYFRLLSAPCSQELRRKLDSSLHLCGHDDASPEHYAQICPRWDGHCPLHMQDGRCQLHAELGEEMLSAVCRLYPRGVRTGADREASCANSCEAVVEALMHHPRPLTFRPVPLSPGLPEAPPPMYDFHTGGRAQEIRLWLITLMQDRSLSLPGRLMRLGDALRQVDRALTARDHAALNALLSDRQEVAAPTLPAPEHEQLLSGLEAIEKMLEIIDSRSPSVHAYGVAALAHFGQGAAAFGRYAAAAEAFAARMPQWENWLENLLVNHMFFARFPFQDRPVPLGDEFLALCAVYALLRFLLLGWTAEHPEADAAADVCAAAFRLVEHTDFEQLAAPLMHRLDCDTPEALKSLLAL